VREHAVPIPDTSTADRRVSMLYPTPRVDRWDPWLVGVLVVALIAAAAVIRFL
jgi:hypothetical protein